MAGNAPTHVVTIKPKEGTVPNRRIGVMWFNEEGRGRIVLDPGVVISWRDMEDCYINFYPRDGERRSRPKQVEDDGGGGGGGYGYDGEDVPF